MKRTTQREWEEREFILLNEFALLVTVPPQATSLIELLVHFLFRRRFSNGNIFNLKLIIPEESTLTQVVSVINHLTKLVPSPDLFKKLGPLFSCFRNRELRASMCTVMEDIATKYNQKYLPTVYMVYKQVINILGALNF